MNIFGTADSDSTAASNPSDYRNYTKDDEISITTIAADSNPNFKISYYKANNALHDDTKTIIETALINYISQPYCSIVGETWIEDVLSQMD